MRLAARVVHPLLSATEWLARQLRRLDDAGHNPAPAATDMPVWETNLSDVITDNIPDAIFIKDRQSRFIRVNQAAASKFGVDAGFVVGKTDYDFFTPENARIGFENEQEVMRTGQPLINLEIEERWADRRSTWASITKMPIYDRDGEIIGTFGISRDITERKRAEEALSASEQRYRAISELISDYAYSFRVAEDGGFEDEWITADSFKRLTGYDWDQLDNYGPFALFHPSERSRLPEEQDMLRRGEAISRDYRIVTKDGEDRWLHITRRPQWDEQHEQIVRFLGIAQDITERKRAEAAEHEQRVLAEALRDIAAALISTIDVNIVMTRVLETVGRVVPHDYASIWLIEGDIARAAYVNGWPEEDEIVLKELRLPLTTRNMQEMIVLREPLVVPNVAAFEGWLSLPWKRRQQPGSYVGAPIEVHGQVIGFLNLDSETTGFFTEQHGERLRAFANQAAIAIENAQLYDELQQHARALEERVAERTTALQHAKEHVEAILENNSDAIIVAQRDGTVNQVNPAFSRLFRVAEKDVLEQPLLALLQSDDKALAEAIQAVTDDGRSRRLEMIFSRNDGSRFDADVVLSPIIEADASASRKSISGVVCGIRDIGERKQIEQALREKLEEERTFQNYLKSLHEITVELTPIEHLDEFYRRAVELGRDRLGFDRLALFLYDTAQNEAVGTYGTDIRGNLTDEHHLRFTPSANGVMTRAFQRAERFWVEDNAPLFNVAQPIGTGWFAAVVLWNGTQSLGWFTADNAIRRQPHSRPLLEILALYGLTVGTLLAQKRSNLALLESEANLATAQRIAGIGSWELDLSNLADLNSNPLRWSDELFRIFGFQPGEVEVTNELFFSMVHPDDRAIIAAAVAQSLATGNPYRIDHRIRLPDGTERFIHEDSTLVADEQSGRPLKMIGTVQDITERKQAELAVQQALDSEKELGELKSRFISMASHEFRTPLASILSSTELLMRYRARMEDQQIERKLGTVKEQVQYLTTVIEDVFDLSRMQSAWADFKPAENDLDALCRSILDEFASSPEVARRLRYSSTQSPLMTMLDKKLMHRVITNLVSNALKYSRPETTVYVDIVTNDESALLYVRDFGIGIPAADLKHLFEPFHRASNVGTIQGTGLGLTITKQAIELHGGSIDVESDVDAGTKFIVTLPLKTAQDDVNPTVSLSAT